MGKLRRILLGLAVVLAVLGCGAQAFAAGVPVYLEGRRVAQAEERQGVTFLPLRAFAEALDARVDWRAAEQRVVVSFSDGRVLNMQVGAEEAWLTTADGREVGFGQEYPLYLSRGTVYLPVRFIARNVLEFGVDYQAGEVRLSYPVAEWGEYRLNLYNGEFRRGERLLGRLELPGYTSYQGNLVTGLQKVEQTEAGNYLVTGCGISYGALSYSLKWYCWLDAASGESVWDMDWGLTEDELPDVWAAEGKVYFYGRNADGLICVDESTGEARTLTGGHNCWWAKGDWLLSGGAAGFALHNLATGESRDIMPQLVTAELKEQVNEFLRANDPRRYPDEERFEIGFWCYLGNMMMLGTMDDFPYLEFVGEEAGCLNFNLCCRYVKVTEREAYTDTRRFPVSLSIDELGL